MGSRMYNLDEIIAAGVLPNSEEKKHALNRIPSRLADGALYSSAKRIIRTIDEQNAISRFKWYNLPCNITGEELERFLYYKGQLAFFYMPELGEFFFMPYALNGTIDFYGRFNSITPVPMANGTSEVEKKQSAIQMQLLQNKKLKVIYGVPSFKTNEEVIDAIENSCVLLHDHCKQMSEIIIPRQQLNDALCSLEAELIAYARTDAIASSGVKGLRVGSGDESANAMIANESLRNGALAGDVFTAMIGNVEFQELLEKPGAKMEEYYQAMQAVDNLRLSTYGLGEGQVFEKKAHMLQTEADKNQSNVGVVLSSDLSIRQNFCNIVNNLYGLGVWCEPNEAYAGQDLNGDGNDYSSDTEGNQAAVENESEGE